MGKESRPERLTRLTETEMGGWSRTQVSEWLGLIELPPQAVKGVQEILFTSGAPRPGRPLAFSVLVLRQLAQKRSVCTSEHKFQPRRRSLLASGIDGTELLALTPTALRMSLTLGKIPAAESVAGMILAERDGVNEARELSAG